MPIALLASLAVSLRILVLAALMVAPLAAVTFAASNGVLGAGKQGAGLVLFVTLQRQAMS
ncbi:hypothetical protein IB238_02920 [Rhizobium sp. ARZ01]|uniref:hypothetical protein n=1 Tax=Rhizobium sp. ARZ01 TaxID=2769313 RepID=UPI00177D6AD1|nr:hypothetical protein [Rhizobium sp. ARZ01]MBD9371594.1 hypothetical protein [Rhizobium sp. ARZ01]